MSGLYRRWVLANAVAEALGLGTTFLIGGWAAPRLVAATEARTVLLGALAAVLLGALLEGVIVGLAQARALRGALEELRPRTWIAATSIGAGLAWLLGMIPSTVMALTASEGPGPPPGEPSALAQYALAILLGLVTGPILGGAQWVVLKRHVPRASRWLVANALAWAVAMPVIFLGMDWVPWEGAPPGKYAAIYAVCGASGMVAGAVHGRVLLRLLSERHRPLGAEGHRAPLDPEPRLKA